jgi:hypothetical protein
MFRCPLRALLTSLTAFGFVAVVTAHDSERTEVTITFSRDGSFVVDVANDPDWLRARLARFDGSFSDRIVLWVDGREVRPVSEQFLLPRREGGVATYRLRGQMPSGSRTLQWYYGLVVDPYPLTIRRADGKTIGATVPGDAWSPAVDLSGQFFSPLRAGIERQLPIAVMLAVLCGALSLGRVRGRRRELL